MHPRKNTEQEKMNAYGENVCFGTSTVNRLVNEIICQVVFWLVYKQGRNSFGNGNSHQPLEKKFVGRSTLQPFHVEVAINVSRHMRKQHKKSSTLHLNENIFLLALLLPVIFVQLGS